ncbi:MAG TPA: hypothetical protein VLN42_00295 [Casimicrobiaceae bacterium]|nr:hypothetical protein [Casimicrobiaceae bacterium]
MVSIVFVLGLFSGASTAQTLTVPISVNCVNPTSELCSPPANIPVTTAGVLQVSYAAPSSHCGDVLIHFLVDGVERAATTFLGPGQASGTFDLGPVSAGSHTLGVQGEGRVGGCNTGIETGFGGTVQIILSPLVAAVQPVPAPGLAITAVALLIAAFGVFRYRRT